MNLANGDRSEARYLRSVWASMLNEAYERARLDLRVDHRSCKEREADRWVREATEHMGPTLTQADRKAARQARREIRPGTPEPGPVTELGRENRRRRAASLEREAACQATDPQHFLCPPTMV